MKLRIAEDLKLPLEAVTETFAILGRRGSGKTHTAVVMAEEMLGAGVPAVVIDPLDVWWGLRVSKDGKKAGFPIYVCGGAHQDIPLTADAGKVLADAIVDRGLSMVLSLRHLSKNDQRRFVGEFCERLYDRKADPKHRTALHVFIDEADAFVPQRLIPGSERCFGAVDTMVRRGRSSGLAVTLISQRPQVINKDVLSQTEVLVSHQLTGPQDRKALEAWIEANDTENRRGEFMGSLASLKRGTAWFWSPGLLSIFKPVAVRDRQTFDSSATPKAGVTAVASPKAFAAVDLEKLTAEIAATIEKAKADDPRELRKQIAAVKVELHKVANERDEARRWREAHPDHAIGQQKTVERFVLTDGDRALLEKVATRLADLRQIAETALQAAFSRAVAALSTMLKNFEDDVTERAAADGKAFAALLDQKGLVKILGKLAAVQPQPQHPTTTATARPSPHARREATALPQASGSRPARVVPPSNGNGDGIKVGKCERAILTVLANQPDGCLAGKLTLLAGYSFSGTFSNALGALRSAGYIVGANTSVMSITDAGRAALGEFEPLPTGRALGEYWLNNTKIFGKAERTALAAFLEHPEGLTADQVCKITGYSFSGTFSNALGALRTAGVLVGKNTEVMKASDELFD